MPLEKLTPSDRRSLILAAAYGESPTALARQYGVSRSRVYALLEEAKINAEEKLEDAEEELEFRRHVADKFSEIPEKSS